MRSRIILVVKGLWIALTAIVLLTTLYYYDGRPNSDADLLLALGMLTLSFPISWLLSGVAALLGELAYQKFGLVVETSYSSIMIRWLCLFAAGYWQWFRGVPWLFRRVWGKVP
jgi:hypothetical protein